MRSWKVYQKGNHTTERIGSHLGSSKVGQYWPGMNVVEMVNNSCEVVPHGKSKYLTVIEEQRTSGMDGREVPATIPPHVQANL